MKNEAWNGMHDGKIYDTDLRKSRRNRKSHAQRKSDIASKESGKK